MQGTNAAASAAGPSLAVNSQSDLERKPTWTQLSFDDGFDLNLAGTSTLATLSSQNPNANAGPSATSLTNPPQLSASQTFRPLGEYTRLPRRGSLPTSLCNLPILCNLVLTYCFRTFPPFDLYAVRLSRQRHDCVHNRTSD